ncbi:DNA-binding transcriptional regulator, MurR/RpiR family, contains HTH and SIS domains [Salinibacillus kushneri]|uniref:DNA-binding transcriptional regulator, MurR/RpiR family, contains HTH and SIS domains n=1 Tax=Salinibacillus kushneri TaxID=237682 RepID=A0A1I0ACE9_9BACI|nr:MurR/RpiR family transcriptional regulator [Salinibacillus kushneri]SES91838.1 DNA-binding transcriptional regulator, MurR/RpiR family, contains HTH and SIS domains [Salinibacillus kushneri]
MGPLLTRIKDSLPSLSEAEKKMGLYVLKQPELIPNMTTKELSQKSGTSESSVVRFCKSIGIGSFKSFKLELVKELAMNEEKLTDFNFLQDKSEPYDIFQKVTHVNTSAIEAIPTSLDRKEFQKAVHTVNHAERLIFYGVGGSATAAVDGYYKFTKLGYACTAHQDFHFLLSSIPYLKKNDVIMAISMSGKTKDVLELSRFAQKEGASVIAITNLDKSPLYKEADIRLCTPIVEHDYRIGSIPSRMTQLTIIDALYLSVFKTKGEDVLPQYHEARNEVIRLRR